MKTFSLLLILSLCAPPLPSFAQDDDAEAPVAHAPAKNPARPAQFAAPSQDSLKESRLKQLVRLLFSFSDEDYNRAMSQAPEKAEGNQLGNRLTAIKTVCTTMASLEYQQAGEKRADPAPQETGVLLNMVEWMGNAALNYWLNGGQTFVGRSIEDPKVAKIEDRIDALDQQVHDPSAGPEQKAVARQKLGAEYEKLAAAASPDSQDAAAVKKEARIKQLADLLEQTSDDDYRAALAQTKSADHPDMASREKVLKSSYKTLAALEYRQAARADAGEKYSAAYQRVSREKSLMINPETLQETGLGTTLLAPKPPLSGIRQLKTAAAQIKASRDAPQINTAADVGVPLGAEAHYGLAQGFEKKAAALGKPAVAPAPAEVSEAPARSAKTRSPQDIYKSVGSGVVLIVSAASDGHGELGTGSLIDGSGKILTNAHVIMDRSAGQPYERTVVYFKPARLTGDQKKDMQNPREGKVALYDADLDLAVVEIQDVPSKAAVVPLGDDEQVQMGQTVIAIGHPENGGLWTLTRGVIGTVMASLGGVQGKDAFQTDASINRGNSGGPLFNLDGELIGVNTSMSRQAKDGLAITGENFSIKSGVVKRWLSAQNVPFTQGAAPALAQIDEPKAAEEPKTKVEEPKSEPAPKRAPAAEPSKPAVEPKAEILTPKRPFSAEDLIHQEMSQMEDLEKEMKGEVDKRRGEIEAQGQQQ